MQIIYSEKTTSVKYTFYEDPTFDSELASEKESCSLSTKNITNFVTQVENECFTQKKKE